MALFKLTPLRKWLLVALILIYAIPTLSGYAEIWAGVLARTDLLLLNLCF